MNDDVNIEATVDKVMAFAAFFLSLGDMTQTDLLLAISNRDPEFADYFENITEPVETAADFFRIYAESVIANIKNECRDIWEDVIEKCTTSARYENIKIQYSEANMLPGILEKAWRHGGIK